MTRSERIQSIIDGSHSDVYEDPTSNVLDLTSCFDLNFGCDEDCADFHCDCCGDLTTTNSIENCIRIILGTNINNFFSIPGLNWSLLRELPLNSSGLRLARTEFNRALSNYDVQVDVQYEDQQFCVNVYIPDELTTLCIRTFDGTITRINSN